MSNTAENFRSNSVDVDGLEDLYGLEAQTDPEHAQGNPTFEAQTDPGQAQDHPTLETQTDLGQAQSDPTIEGIPLADAAELLDLHIDTVRKRLQKGKLAGFKSDEKFGQKWFVCRSELAHLQSEAQTEPEQAQDHPTFEAQTDPEPDQSDPATETMADPALEPQYDPSQLLAVIENQAYQLKAAGDVIMYMRSELEEKNLQLKLLTDSQNQPTRWQRFVNWFLGR